MALTRDFKATVRARVQADPAFRDPLLREGIETLLGGDVDTGKAILRDYIKATVGFEKTGCRNRFICKEPHPHVRAQRQPAGAQFVRRAWAVAEGCGTYFAGHCTSSLRMRRSLFASSQI